MGPSLNMPPDLDAEALRDDHGMPRSATKSSPVWLGAGFHGAALWKVEHERGAGADGGEADFARRGVDPVGTSRASVGRAASRARWATALAMPWGGLRARNNTSASTTRSAFASWFRP